MNCVAGFSPRRRLKQSGLLNTSVLDLAMIVLSGRKRYGAGSRTVLSVRWGCRWAGESGDATNMSRQLD